MIKKLLLCVTISAMFLFTACAKEDASASSDNTSNKSSTSEVKTENDESIYDTLSEEQKTYLTDVQALSKDAIDLMDYEAINWNLLGTGFELYNQTSGVEIYGLSYTEDEPIKDSNDTDVLLSLDKAREIRLKEKDMRLEDFSAYKYSIRKLSEDSDNAYVMEVPLADYEDAYVDIIFTREDKTINMKVPHIISKAGDEDYVFSILYDNEALIAYCETEPKYTMENKMYMGVQYSSVTENSLVVKWWNHTDKEYKLDNSYELYEVTENGEKLIDSFEGEEINVKGNTFSIKGVKFGENIKLVDGSAYILKYGKNQEGYMYCELEFVK